MRTTRRIVVDASIAHSCGSGEAPVRQGAICRQAIDAILKVCHRVVFSRALREEWRRHESSYARSWLVQMSVRRKVIDLSHAEIASRLVELQRRIHELGLAPEVVRILEKDLHLVAAALATDAIVLSKDRKAQYHFREAAHRVDELASLVWGTLLEDEEARQIVVWLKAGAKVKEGPRLLPERG